MSAEANIRLKAALLNARAAMLQARVCGMNAENCSRHLQDEPLTYVEADYIKAMEECGLADDAAIQEALYLGTKP